MPPADEVEVICLVHERLQGDHFLDAEKAVEWALLHNPKIQETFEELGIAQAELVEAGLLSNPSFELEVRYPNSRCLQTNIEYLITGSVLDLFLRPIRVKVAEAEYEKVKLKVIQEILDLAFEVRSTYYALLFERKLIKYAEASADLADIRGELAARQKAVGNVNELEAMLVQSEAVALDLEWKLMLSEQQRLQEKLNRLLGATCGMVWEFPEPLPERVSLSCNLEALQDVALASRLDLQAAVREIERLCEKLGLTRAWAYTNLRAGLAGEQEPDGDNLVGFGLAGEIPLFNYGQAARLRLYAELRQAMAHEEVLRIRILSEVREAYKILSIESKLISTYQEKLLPDQAQISSLSEEQYNEMTLGVSKLLENKQREMASFKAYYESLKRYWMTSVEMERALGTSWGAG